MQTPPLVSGALPVLGHALEMMNNRDALFQRGFAEHGDLFAIKLGNQFAVILGDKAYNRAFYSQTDKELNISDAYAPIKAAFGDVVFAQDPAEYTNQRPVLQTVFKRERMEQYIKAMNIEVQAWLDSLGDEGRTNITRDMQVLTQFVVAQAFFGEKFREELDDKFWAAYLDIGKSLDMIFPPNLPLPKFIRRDKATKLVRDILGEMIAKRQANPDKYDDLITILLETPRKDGRIMSTQEMTNLFMGLLFAGHETTAGQAAWTIIHLLHHPEHFQKVQAEVDAKTRYGQDIDAAVLHHLEYTYWAIDETSRLNPSADIQMRIVEKDIQFGDYTVPAGWRAMVSALGSHFDEKTFENAHVFDPMRYSPERKEGGDPFAFVSFGGGIHKCTGMNFAKNEMAVITALLLQQFDIELETKESHVVTGLGANRPSETWIRYRRKPIQQLLDEKTIQEATAAGCPHIKSRLETA